MADALAFTLQLTDKFSGPAGKAALQVRKLTADILSLRDAIAQVQALGAVKVKVSGKVGALQGPKGAKTGATDTNATGAAAVFKLDPAKAAKAQEKALRQQQAAEQKAARAKQASERAAQRDQQKALRFSQRADNEIKKAQKLAESNIAKKAKAQQAADAKAAKAAEKAQKLAQAEAASAEAASLAGRLSALVNPATLAAAAVAALGAAFAYATIEGAALVLDVTEAKGDTIDMLEAMLGTAKAASDTYAQVEQLTRDFAISLSSAQGLAQSLTAAGVTDAAQLQDAMRGIAQLDSVIKGAGGKIENLISKASQTGKFQFTTKQLVGTGIQVSALYEEIARRTGQGVKEVEQQIQKGKLAADVGISALTAVIDKKFGALASKQALDFSAQMVKLRDNLRSLFDDVDTGPFLAAMQQLVQIFDSATPSGRTLKLVITGIFDTLFGIASTVIPYVRTALLGLAIIALRVYIAFKPLAKAVRDAFGGDSTKGPKDLAGFMSELAKNVGLVVDQMVKILMVPGMWDLIVFSVKVTATSIKFLAFNFLVLQSTVLFFLAVGLRIFRFFQELPVKAYNAGKAVVNGLILGLTNPGRLYEAVTNLARGALERFKAVFGIASPSKVMASMGANVVAGFNQGLDANRASAMDNMANVVDLNAYRSRVGAGPQGAAPQAPAPAGAGVTVTFREGAFQISGVADADHLAEILPAALANAFEQMGLANGTGEGVAA